MESPQNIDKHLLAQHIRFNAHMLDVATRINKIDQDAREKNLADLQVYLKEWNNRNYKKGPDYVWAEERIARYKTRIEKGILAIKKPVWSYDKEEIAVLKHMINTRRSVRFWKKKHVSRDLIDQIISAATYAPTAFNRMEWKFFVAETPEDNMNEGDASNPSMFEKAPVRIFIAIDERLFFEKYSGSLDTGLAMQNMILMAHALGLSTCLIYQGEFVDPALLEKHYNIPLHFKVYCAVTLGYPADDPDPPARMDPQDVTEYLGIMPNPNF